jgi:hypothetical protein
MSLQPIPAPGFTLHNGKRGPRKPDSKWWVQLATDQEGVGWCDLQAPWPGRSQTRDTDPVWTWKGEKPGPWEIVARKAA